MGAWGYGLFQSDSEYDLASDLAGEAGVYKLEEEAKAKFKATLPPKSDQESGDKTQEDKGYDEEVDHIHYNLYGDVCSDVPAVREYLDNGALQALIDKYFAKFGRPKDKGDWHSAEYTLVMIGACAMTLGCKLRPVFLLLLKRLYQHVNLMPMALKQMKKALGPQGYKEGQPYDFESLGLIDTANAKPSTPNSPGWGGLNVHGKGTMFEPRVPAPQYPTTVCGGCGAPEGEGEGQGGALLSCNKCKSRKYCSKVCQKVHWPAHKKSCKAPAGGK